MVNEVYAGGSAAWLARVGRQKSTDITGAFPRKMNEASLALSLEGPIRSDRAPASNSYSISWLGPEKREEERDK